VAGAASTGRVWFHHIYVKTKPELVDEAARQAAALAAHTLTTGEIGPLMRFGERVAILPVSAPTVADKLVFTAQGRKVLPAAVHDLPADVSEKFAPDLLPLFPDSILRPAGAMLRQIPPATALWTGEDTPNTNALRVLGRQLRVDYLLLARVTSLELSVGPPDPTRGTQAIPNQKPEVAPEETKQNRAANVLLLEGTAQQPVWEREARAEAVGALVRVEDGVVVWQHRATATMTARSPVGGAEGAADKQVMADAVRFALVELQRLFWDYRARFEN
jgi:hypothetical protein